MSITGILEGNHIEIEKMTWRYLGRYCYLNHKNEDTEVL